MSKFNAEQVDAVFALMFETFWVAPYDRRRSNPLLVDFEWNARQTALLLSTTDAVSAEPGRLEQLREALAALGRSVERLAGARLFPDRVCDGALRLLEGICEALETERRKASAAQAVPGAE